MVDGSVTVGPNAVLSFAREGYRWSHFSARDVLDMASFSGFWPLIAKNVRSGLSEMRNSLFCRNYLELCRRYCPELAVGDLEPYPSGVRAQAVMRDGSIVQDFLIRRTARTIHVCNAPSPAATSAIPIGRYVALKAQEMF
jgi:L-2-hydroxyglutarate oxidase